MTSLGMTLATFRRGGAGGQVRYATADAALGRVLAAVTDLGVCSVQCMTEADLLVAALTRAQPRAALSRDPDLAASLKTAVRACDPEAPLLLGLKAELRRVVLEARITTILSRASIRTRALRPVTAHRRAA